MYTTLDKFVKKGYIGYIGNMLVETVSQKNLSSLPYFDVFYINPDININW